MRDRDQESKMLSTKRASACLQGEGHSRSLIRSCGCIHKPWCRDACFGAHAGVLRSSMPCSTPDDQAIGTQNGLPAVDHERESPGLHLGPGMGILWSGGGGGAELCAHGVDFVVGGVQRHGSSAFHRGDGLYHGELIWRIFMR